MGNFFIKQGDLLPRIRSTLLDANGNPINLVGAAVSFRMRLLGAPTLQVNAAATVIDGLNGIVEYAWQGTDTAIAGGFAGEWAATIGGQPMTIPNFNYLNVLISPNLLSPAPTPPAPPAPPTPPLPYSSQVLQILAPQTSDGVSVNSTGIAANAPGNAMGGTFHNPDVARTVRVQFPIGWDGGAVSIPGLDQFGNAIVGLVAANPGGFGETVKAYSQVTGASKSLVGASSGVATLGFGQALGIDAVCFNNAALLFADNVPIDGTLDIVNNTITPDPLSAPNGSISYVITVNVA